MCFHTLNNTEPFQHVIYLRTFDERPLTPYHNREIVFGGALLKKKKKKKKRKKKKKKNANENTWGWMVGELV